MRVLQPPTCMICEKTGHKRNECAYINGMNHPPDQDKLIDNNLWARAYEYIREDFGTYSGYRGRSTTGIRCRLCGLFGHQKRSCAYNPNKWAIYGEPSRTLREEQARITRVRIHDENIESQRQQMQIYGEVRIPPEIVHMFTIISDNARQIPEPRRVPQPVQNLNPPQEKAFEATECPVCCEPLAETNKVITRCGHQFCVTCFVQSLGNQKNECPMCRDNVLERDVRISVN